MRRMLTSDEAAHWLREQRVRHLAVDSRRVQPGDAFVAWPGGERDGRQFVPDSLTAGAIACLMDAHGAAAWGYEDNRVAVLDNLKHWGGDVAAQFYGQPSRRLRTVAVTGTNGKTSTAWWCAQWLSALGTPSALIGTLGAGVPGGELESTGFTTPDPITLQRLLARSVEQAHKAVVLEASSIGIDEGRINGLQLHTAVFTNLSQDHLDYHGSMEAYWAAKRALFDWPGVRVAVVNTDDVHGEQLAAELRGRSASVALWTVSSQPAHPLHRQAVLQATQAVWADHGVTFQVVHRPTGQSVSLTAPVVGDYNVNNLLCALAVVCSGGVSLADAAAALSALSAVPGRMEAAWPQAPAGLPLVLVDYAHTPDAVEQALRALQPLAHHRGGRLWCVLGCGGDRDRAKRPLMAAAAEREAARLVLTSDNPRSEDPLQILHDMQAGLTEPVRALVEPDRREAIRAAIWQADTRDVVLIAGKGHETYQEMAGERRPFSDVTEGRNALQQRPSTSTGGQP